MRRVDEQPLDPEVAETLDAIDATLAGEPVDPRFAEIAELALLLTASRPQLDWSFAAALDGRVERRFASHPDAPSRRRRTRWALSAAWGGGIVAAAAVLVVAVVLVGGGGGSSASFQNGTATFSSGASTTTAASAPSHAATSAAFSSAGTAVSRAPSANHGTPQVPQLLAAQRPSAAKTASSATYGTAGTVAAGAPNATLTPPATGRKIIQSAQLSLTTPPARIDTVAQEVFNVVGAQSGFVQRSNVTAAGAGNSYAQFQLSVPSANLSQTMSQLSQLKFATVSSRTDATQDVNDQYVGDVRRLNDAKALRTALLKQLANAVTTSQIDSLNQQIHDADSAISSAQSTLNGLNHQIDYSQIQVTINGALIAPAKHHRNTGFTLGKAAHDSGRVLTVAAGVALIALAALVPLALLAALGWWVVTAVRRRRREQALDVA
jgi:hypothetical protein